MIEIRTVKHSEEIEQLTELYISTFNHKTTTRFWEWKYVHNPLAADMPDVTVALDGSRIVGARPFLLSELWVGNQKIAAAQHCDTMVHNDYRRQGIFNRMGEFALRYMAEHGYAISYGFPAPVSRKGFASQGYRRLLDTEIVFRLMNPAGIIINKFRNIKQSDLSLLYKLSGRVHDGTLPSLI